MAESRTRNDHATMALSQSRRFTVLVGLPLAVFAVTYLLAPLYAKQPGRPGVLPILFLIEAVAVGLPALAIFGPPGMNVGDFRDRWLAGVRGGGRVRWAPG